MRLKIVSDGTADGTRVVDDTGRPLDGLTSVTWQMQPDRTVSATLVIRDMEAELMVEAEEVPDTRVVVCPICEVRLEVKAGQVKGRDGYVGSGVKWKCGACGKTTHAEDWFDTSGMN